MRLIDADKLERIIMQMPIEKICDDCAYNVISEMDNMPTVSGWVSVKDRMPEENGTYLIYDGYCVVCAIYDKYRECSWTDIIEEYLDYNVTHWMPLPEPPEVSGDD